MNDKNNQLREKKMNLEKGETKSRVIMAQMDVMGENLFVLAVGEYTPHSVEERASAGVTQVVVVNGEAPELYVAIKVATGQRMTGQHYFFANAAKFAAHAAAKLGGAYNFVAQPTVEAVETTTYYAVCNVGGPISVRLEADTKEDAITEFSAGDRRAWIDGCQTDAEDDFGIIGADMNEAEFDTALRASGLTPVEDLSEIVNAQAGTVAHLRDGWYLWVHEEPVSLAKLTPIIIVTSDRWSREPYVVFEGEEIIGGAIPEDWISDRMQYLTELGENADRGEVAAEMANNFRADNSRVDDVWPEHMICRSGRDYYRYDSDGMVEWLGDHDNLVDALEV